MAKFADGGSSRILQGRDLLGLVLAHVGYELGTPEQELHDHSPLISFSTDAGTAFGFSDRTRRKDLVRCSLHEATYFIWQLDIATAQPIETGRYALRFRSDPVNCEAFVQEELRRGLEMESRTGELDAIAIAVMNAGALGYARNDQAEHYAEVIDVVSFVKCRFPNGDGSQLVENTIARATRDQEWLLYPMDPMHDGSGYSSRFPMNRHLRLHGCFKVRGQS